MVDECIVQIEMKSQEEETQGRKKEDDNLGDDREDAKKPWR